MQRKLNLTETARDLRKHSTDAEWTLWRNLRGGQLEGHRFRRQEQIGRFIVDFVCYEKKLIVEADGGQHIAGRKKDEERTAWLTAQGFNVIRFWNNEVLTNREGVLEHIRKNLDSACNHPSPQSSPTRGEEG